MRTRTSVLRSVLTGNALGWIVVVLIIVLWQLLVSSGAITIAYIPAPTGVAEALVQAAISGKLFVDIAHTLGIALGAFATAAVA